MHPIQMYTDLTYGLLILLGLIGITLFGHSALFTGIGIGIFVGYAVHVGSNMVKYTQMMDSVEETAEETKKTREETKKVAEAVEETKEVVQEVDQKTEEVEKKVADKVDG